MIQLNSILFPTDFSDCSHRAHEHACGLARRFGSRLTALHVRSLYIDDPAAVRAGLQEVADETTDQGFAKVEEHSEHIELHTEVIRAISPAAGILDYLSEHPADLLVMGSHGHTGLKHFLLGSVAEKVIRHAACPVMTVGPAERHSGPSEYTRLLAAFDFSEPSSKALKHAVEVAQRFEAELHVLYVIEQEIHPAYYDIWRESIAKALPEIRKDAQAALEKSIDAETLKRVNLHVEVGEGKAHREIVNFASRNEIDLILMGTHGLSGVEHFLLGSTTERVIRIAECPVLSFK